MAGKWAKTTLGAEVEMITGFPFKSEGYTESDNSIRLVRGDNIIQGAMRWDGVKKWPLSDTSDYALFQLREGDVVLAMDRPWIEAGLKYATISKYDLPCLLVQRTARLRGGPRLATEFLRYLIGSHEFTQHVHAITTGTAVPHISGSQIKNFSFLLPPLPEQRAIAHILGTLDDKIELNRRMNATLEAMARALFQSWFVDFDPVRAKLDRRHPPGLDKATAALFSASFNASAIGPIPNGWMIRPLSELCCYLSRGIGPAYLEAGGVLVLNQKCIRDHHVDCGLGRRHDDQRKPVKGRLVGKLDILVNSTGVGTLGRVAQVLNVPEPMIVDSHVTIIRASATTEPHFLGGNLSGREPEIEALGEGSTGQTELSRVRLASLPILTPPCEIQSAFGKVVQPLLERISSNEAQSRTLATLRDTLLPKLLSGELSLSERSITNG